MLPLLLVAIIAFTLSGSTFAVNIHRRGITTNPLDLTSTSFDYVIVGGGTAGLVLANRLSADPKTTVAVIEAGDAGDGINDRIQIPVMTYLEGVSVPGSPYDWGYYSQSMNRTQHWPRGKILGGSSAINAEYAVRASKIEHDAWATLNPGGATDWSWNSFYPYMRKTENYHPPSASNMTAANIKVNPDAHNNNGPIHTSYPHFQYDQVNMWVPTLGNLGIDTRDPGNGEAWGAYITPNTIDPSTETRSYAKTGYLDPVAGRPNLVVLLGYQATKIGMRAKGSNGLPKPDSVEIAASSTSPRFYVKVNKELILSAGVVGSPQLLQLSGIGPKYVLGSLGIPTVVDLPGVGEHLQDHVVIPVVWSTNASVTGDATALDSALKAQQLALFKSGQFSQTLYSAPNNAIAYINLKQLLGKDRAATFLNEIKANQSSILNTYTTTDASVKAGYQLTYTTETNLIIDSNVGVIELLMSNTGTFDPSHKTLSIQASIQHPFSRGNLVINSTDPFTPPRITPNYLNNDVDWIILREGFKWARLIGNTAPLSGILTDELQPGPNVVTDKDIDNYIGTNAATQYHPASSCSQLPRDKGGVVDTELKVYGTDGLRVIDSSIIPIGLGAHLMMPTFAIAEKGADIVLGSSPITRAHATSTQTPWKLLLATLLCLLFFT